MTSEFQQMLKNLFGVLTMQSYVVIGAWCKILTAEQMKLLWDSDYAFNILWIKNSVLLTINLLQVLSHRKFNTNL